MCKWNNFQLDFIHFLKIGMPIFLVLSYILYIQFNELRLGSRRKCPGEQNRYWDEWEKCAF